MRRPMCVRLYQKVAIVFSILLAGVMLISPAAAQAANQVTDAERIQWFEHDKFGMFIHWGPYSNLAGEWKGHQTPVGDEAEWIMQRFNIPVTEYREMAHKFYPQQFNAAEWVALAKAAGMKYLVITAKHHDGFAMYHSKVSKYNIVDWTPFKRDPLSELSAECRKAGIRFCVYYSHREDWEHPDGYGNTWDYDRSQKNFDRYLEQKSKPQLRELLSNYGPLGLVWFDRGMDTREHAREFVQLVREIQPRCLINGRVGNYNDELLGDYQDMNDNGMPAGGLQEYWETPQTLNTTWGYSKFDQQWKTPGDVIHRMVEIVSKGGNYLLNIGPKGDGAIPGATVSTLRKVGEWMQSNSESIYGTSASPLPEQPWGYCTAKRNTLYLHVFSWPADGKLRLPRLETQVRDAYALLAPSGKLAVTKSYGTTVLALPSKPLDENDTVIVAHLAAPPRIVPPTVTQGTESPFHLNYASAITAGKAIKRFNRSVQFYISKWTNPADSITWHLLVSQTGNYNVRIRYSAREDSRNAKYSIEIGDQIVAGVVQPTGESYQFRTFDLGAVKFPTPGEYTVQIRPAADYQHDLMYFQSLELAPAGLRASN